MRDIHSERAEREGITRSEAKERNFFAMYGATHAKRREGDEWFCRRCGKRWAADEKEPDCA